MSGLPSKIQELEVRVLGLEISIARLMQDLGARGSTVPAVTPEAARTHLRDDLTLYNALVTDACNDPNFNP